MMANLKVPTRYAASLLDLAVEKNLENIISGDIDLIISVMEKNPGLGRALESPVIRPEIKLSVLNEIFRAKVNTETMHFVRFLVKKGRENLLCEIANQYVALRDERAGIVNVSVRTAFDLTEQQKDELRKKIEKILNKKVRFKLRIDSEVVGGFVAQVKDTVYDASVKHQLEILKQQLLKGDRAAL